MSEHEVSGIASFTIYVDADSPAEAIDKARDEIETALKEGDFQLSEIEANETGGDGFAFEGQ